MALSLCERSEGALDISIYPVAQAWKFTFDENRIPSETELKELLQLVNYKEIGFDEN
ncbi:MAG: FAD:protein FMN transferase [Ruminococcus sp.]|nr:FAD:protein FMN transferase [Ruminococcus sp.]